MIWALLGILIGIILGLLVNVTIPIEYVKYTAVIVVGIIDALFGAIKAELTHDDKYNATIFLSGLIFNIILALIITVLGERLGLDLYLAVTVVFTFRIFSNLSVIRRSIIEAINKKRKS
jgi:small basic protein